MARALTDANLALRREVAVRSHCLRVQGRRAVDPFIRGTIIGFLRGDIGVL